MSGNGGRRQVRQRTSKDAAYAKRLQETGSGGGAGSGGDASSSVPSSTRHGHADTAASTSGGNASCDTEPTVGSAAAASPAASASSAGRKRPRAAAPTINTTTRRPHEASSSPPAAAGSRSTAAASAFSAATDETTAKRQRRQRQHRRGPGPGWACATCTLHNPSRKRKCEACGAAKPAAVPPTSASSNNNIVPGTCNNAHSEQPGAPADAATESASSSKHLARSRSNSSGNSVSEWLRRRKRGKQHQDGGRGGNKDGNNRNKSSTGSGNGSGSGRSRSKSPIPPASATGSSYLEGIDPRVIKSVRVRLFYRCDDRDSGNTEINHPSQRRELSDSGPLVAKVLVGWPKFCAIKGEVVREDTEPELQNVHTEKNEIGPAGAVAGASGIDNRNDSEQAVTGIASSSDSVQNGKQDIPSSGAIGFPLDADSEADVPCETNNINESKLPTPAGTPVNTIDASLMNPPSQPNADEAGSTKDGGFCRKNEAPALLGDKDRDQYQSFAYDLEARDYVEASTKEAAAELSGHEAMEKSTSGVKGHEESIASDEMFVGPGSSDHMTQTSRLEANCSSPSETIARMSQESNDNYDAFQPLTQAVPIFEYGYDLTQQQEECALSYCNERVEIASTSAADTDTGACPAECQAMPASKEEKSVEPDGSVEAGPAASIGEKLSGESEQVLPRDSFESVPKIAETSTASLFSTGGGDSISISGEAMVKASQMFGETSDSVTDVSLPDSNQNPAESSTVAPGPASLFSTARGTSISISAEAIKRAENIFSDPVQEFQAKESKEPEVEGELGLLSTAGGSSMSVSEDALEKVAGLFHGQSSDSPDTNGKAAHPAPHPTAFVASTTPAFFSTAGGSEIQVSDEALASAGNLLAKEAQSKASLQSSPLGPSSSQKGYLSTSTKKASETLGAPTVDYGLGLATQSPSIAKTSAPTFSTAGKKRDIAVDPRAIAQANEVLGGEQVQIRPAPPPAVPSLFYTAGKGITIEISEESLVKANQIMEGTNNNTGASVQSPAGPPTGAAALFSTAGGSSISVTADALAKASEIFGGPAQKVSVEPCKAPPVALSITDAPSAAPVFSAAGGVSIVVPDDAIVKAGQLFGNKSQEQPSPTLPAVAAAAAPAPSAVALFSTAGGTSISVSDDAMAKANRMLKRTDQDQYSSSSAQPRSMIGMAGLFSTAGGSSIAITADAMSKANQIFAEPTERTPSSTAPTSSAALFSTARGSSIAVSHDALVQANHMLIEAGTVPPSFSSSSSKPPIGTSSLFLTAGGASIDVSDDPLAQANQLFRTEMNKEPGSDDPSYSSSSKIPPPMFPTAENKEAISMSDQGLANEIFGILQEQETHAPAIPITAMFATAGRGVSISVSDDALMKANEMFAQNSSMDPPNSSSNQGEAKDTTRGAERPRIQFAETPAQSSVRRRINRSSLGGTAAKNVNIAQHMHPAETPLPDISRGGSAQPLSTKKVLFREDNHHDRSRHVGGRKSSGTINGCTTGQNVANTGMTTAAAFTPKQTPQVIRKPVAVTRSTIVRNPYAKGPGTGSYTNSKSTHSSAVTPVPFTFKHVEGTFAGKKFSPKTLERAARILAQPDGHSSTSRSSARRGPGCDSGTSSTSTNLKKPRHLNMNGATRGTFRLDGSDFYFSIDGSRLSLQEFDDIYGPMEEANHQACVDGGANPVLLKINSANASKLRFNEQTGLPYAMFGAGNASGSKAIGNVQDLRRDLISRGCDEALLVDRWIVNHFGWVNWKLACTERRYPRALAGKYFTYDHVLSQLKGRYDREIADAKRPALRIILNRDASAGRLMILCIAQIHHFRVKVGSGDSTSGESNSPHPSSSKSFREELRLELTDGWYSVQAVLDSHLQSFVEQEKVKVGTKLLIAGAELVGSEDGIDPLDASYQPSRSSCPVALKLVANATRRAKWDAKLGFVRPTRKIQSQDALLLVRSMGDVIPGGGSVPLMDLIICRRFPRLFLEKGPDGTSTILTEAQEERRRREFDERRHREMERISEAAEKQCTREVDEEAPEQWREMMASNAMCDYYERLPRDDKAIVDRWEERRSTMINDMTRRMIDAKMLSNVSLFRSSTPFLRITVKTLQNPPPPTSAIDEDDDYECIIPNQPSATLTVWRMTEDQSSILTEGAVVRIQDLTVKSELRDEMLQFGANDKTRMQALAQQPSSRQLQYSGFSRRSFAPIIRAHVMSRKASSSRNSSGAYVDFAGVLVRSEHEEDDMVHFSYSYFMDESGLLLRLQRELDPNDESAIVGWDKVLEAGQVLAFKDVLALPFDFKANCAVVSWSQPTLQEKKGHLNDKRIKTLQKWTASEDGQRTCAAVLASFDAGLPLYCRLPRRTEMAVGYILDIRSRDAAGFKNEYGGQYRSVPADHSFEVDIDCGDASNLITATCSRAVLSQTIEMHFDPASRNGAALDLKDLIRQNGGNVGWILAPSDMTNLNLLFAESGILFHVTLRRQTTSLEILQISPANVGALAALYLEALK